MSLGENYVKYVYEGLFRVNFLQMLQRLYESRFLSLEAEKY